MHVIDETIQNIDLLSNEICVGCRKINRRRISVIQQYKHSLLLGVTECGLCEEGD